MSRDKDAPITVVDKDVENLTWQVEAGATIQGIVTTKRGEPVEGANVWARAVGTPPRGQRGWGGGGDETLQCGAVARRRVRAVLRPMPAGPASNITGG